MEKKLELFGKEKIGKTPNLQFQLFELEMA